MSSSSLERALMSETPHKTARRARASGLVVAETPRALAAKADPEAD